MPIIELSINTDRSDSFANIAHFVDEVRKYSNVSDEKIDMKFSFDKSDHEVAVHTVDTDEEWNQEQCEVENETVVVFRKEALTPQDSKSTWSIAYSEREIKLTTLSKNSSCVLDDGQVMIKGIGNFPKHYFRVIKII